MDTYSYWILKGIYLCFTFHNINLFILSIDSGNISKIIDADIRHMLRVGMEFIFTLFEFYYYKGQTHRIKSFHPTGLEHSNAFNIFYQ